ncbi:MAG: sugar ABC transporter permease [Spirochaetales bacterium]|nr:sugar ABC transporter permease [Spirochaetales bacterium]
MVGKNRSGESLLNGGFLKSFSGRLYLWADRKIGYLFITPTILVLGLIVLIPILFSIGMAFFRFDLLRMGQGNPFTGFEHFITTLKNPLFWNALGNTMVWTLSNVVFQLLVGLGLALLLNMNIRFKVIYYVAILIPWATPSAVAALIWRWLLHADYGVLNAVLLKLHLLQEAKAWLSIPGWAMFWVVVARVWKEYAFCTIILTATLQTIPSTLYEAAKVDGAGKVAGFFYITLPWLRSSITIATVLVAIGSFNGFNMIWMMTNGGPVRTTEIISTFIYQTGFERYRLGAASAQSIFMVIILATMIIFYIRRMNREVGDGAVKK